MKHLAWAVLGTALVLGCASPSTPTTNQTPSGFAYSESALNSALTKVASAATYADFDAVVLPPANRSVVPVDSLGKYLFGDEYVATLAGYAGTPVVSMNSETNTWTAQGMLTETVYPVTGLTSDLVRKVAKVSDSDASHPGQYHIYRYYPWTATPSSNVWFGAGHVFYLNPVKGQVAAGAPSLELFPMNATSTTVQEARIEGSSYYRFKGIHAGNTNQGGTDLGSTVDEVTAVLGAPTTSPITDQAKIDDNARGTLFTYPLSATTAGAYLHDDLADGTSVRMFFSGPTAGPLRVIAMYFVRKAPT